MNLWVFALLIGGFGTSICPEAIEPAQPGWMPPAPYGLPEPWYGELDLDIEVSLRPADGTPNGCGIPYDGYALIDVWITNISNVDYSRFHGSSKVWDMYVYEPGTFNFVTRFSYQAGYDDDRYWVELQPGDTYYDQRFWHPVDGLLHPIPPGRYDAYVLLQSDVGPDPSFDRSNNGIISGRFSFVVIEPDEYTGGDEGRSFRSLRQGRGARDSLLQRTVPMELRERSEP